MVFPTGIWKLVRGIFTLCVWLPSAHNDSHFSSTLTEPHQRLRLIPSPLSTGRTLTYRNTRYPGDLIKPYMLVSSFMSTSHALIGVSLSGTPQHNILTTSCIKNAQVAAIILLALSGIIHHRARHHLLHPRSSLGVRKALNSHM